MSKERKEIQEREKKPEQNKERYKRKSKNM